MEQFLAWTAWGMEKPTAYGPFHLIFLIGGLSVCLLAAILLRRVGNKTNNILLFSVGAFLLVSEIYKQLFYTFYIGQGTYQWWIFPFQLCSVPMYLCLILPFIKSEKFRRPLYTFLATFNLLGGFIAMFEPSGLSHEYVTLTLHAFIWHLLLVFVGFYLIASDRAARSFKEYLPSVGVFFGLCTLAQIFNVIFREKDFKMFYISPFHPTPLVVFKQIEQATTWWVNMIVYLFALCLGAFTFLAIGIGLKKLCRYIVSKRKIA